MAFLSLLAPISALPVAIEQARGAEPAAAQAAALAEVRPDNAVLIYVDYVTGLDNLITTIEGRPYRNNIAAFAKFSPLFGMPTALLGEENQYYGTFLPEVRQLLESGGKTFPRTTPSGYTPDLAKWLKETGRKKVVIGGISIDNCTLHTTLDLLRDGYNVYVVVDVSGTNSQVAENAAIARLTAAGAVPVSWLNMLTELGADFAGPHGEGMMGIIQAHWPASTTGRVDDTTPDGFGMQLPGN
jgi:nicotinamidase-related amidase